MATIPIKDYLRESQLFLGRAVFAGILFVLLILVLVARLFYLQVISHEHFTTLAQGNRVKLEPLPPTRGLIFDRSGVLLAQNLPAYSLEITPEQVDNMQETIDRLREIIQVEDADIKRFEQLRRRRRRFERIPIRVRLSEEEAARFAVNRHRFSGVDIYARLLRHYPLGELASHAVGYVGRINERELQIIDNSSYSGTSHIGKIGVEKTYEQLLHGKVGQQQVEINVLGRAVRVLERTAPEPGANLHLFLDMRLHEEAMEALGDFNGAVVAIDPNNGGVLALVSKPSFDPNMFVDGIDVEDYRNLKQSKDKPLFNRALRGQYPPGSTVKPFIGLAGLELALMTSSQTRYCPGFYQLPNNDHKYRDWKKTGHGSVDLDTAIVQSCDVYFYDLARSLGIDRLHDYLQTFGFGRRTNIDLTAELGGLLPSRKWKYQARRQPWFPGETLITGIGQGYFLATPLQLASATATLATLGKRFTPRVVQAIDGPGIDSTSRPTIAQESRLPRQMLGNWESIIEAMRRVVHSERGTARQIRSDAYTIAGKTGTAQVFTIKQDEKYDKENVADELRDHALFIAFAPAEKARIAVAVIVENGGSGGAVAAPIARRIIDRYLEDAEQ